MTHYPVKSSSIPRMEARFRNKRAGNTLLTFLFALIVMVPMALAVFEYGLATLTRRQMQTAVNSAALEGLRLRDDDLFAHDWRQEAKNRIDPIFEIVASAPQIEFTAIDGSQRIINGQKITTYSPAIAQNDGNEVYGDLVVGDYAFLLDEDHKENADYTRTDFEPSGNGDYNSVLVRMRRTKDSYGAIPVPVDDEPEVSSSGPAIPHLWRRGPRATDDTIASKIAPGIRVRATAIALARPALRAGVGNSSLGLTGLVNVTMHVARWRDESAILDGSTTQASIFDPNELRVTVVGESPNWMHVGGSPLSETSGYIALIDDEMLDINGMPTTRVIGFGYATDIQVSGSTLTFTRNMGVASENASATFGQAPVDWDDLDVSFLMSRIHQLWQEDQGNPGDPPNQLLLAPALVRAVGRL